jgi:type IX secretion system PorP/SprF family membrane protein
MYSMYNTKIYHLVVSFVVFFTFLKPSVIVAQDIQFSQFYAVPLYANPAFAGSLHVTRGITNTRLQWLGLAANYKTYYVSGDGYSAKYRSGYGFQILRDEQGANVYSSTQVSGMYAYELPVSSSFTVRAGLQGTFGQRTLDYNGLRFPQQFNNAQGFNGTASPETGIQNQFYPDISSGIVGYSDRFWGGLSVHHLNTPDLKFPGAGKDLLPMNFEVISGYKIPLGHKKYLAYTDDQPEISITPTIHYKSQGASDQLDLGVYGMYSQLMWGVWYRGIPFLKYAPNVQNNESVVLLLGWVYKNVSFGYSYDITVSQLTEARSGGSHEFSITYLHKSSKKHKPMRRLPCPSFYKH